MRCAVNQIECLAVISPCGVMEDCVDTMGSYQCDCKDGYQRSVAGECESKISE